MTYDSYLRRVLVKKTVFLLFCCETRAIARAPPLVLLMILLYAHCRSLLLGKREHQTGVRFPAVYHR